MAGEQAVARNEALFREVNERIREITVSHDLGAGEAVAFLCECSELSCGGTISITLAEYETVRTRPRVFVVAPGHDSPAIERVVGEIRGYLLVEKPAVPGDAS